MLETLEKMSWTKPLVSLNISVDLFVDFSYVLKQICPYLKVLEILTIRHHKLFGDIFPEARLLCHLTCVNVTSMLEDST